jgi:hypothetical protein
VLENIGLKVWGQSLCFQKYELFKFFKPPADASAWHFSRVKFVKYAGGTMFGGRKETVLAWAKAFYAVFLRYSRKNFHHLIQMCYFVLSWLAFTGTKSRDGSLARIRMLWPQHVWRPISVLSSVAGKKIISQSC